MFVFDMTLKVNFLAETKPTCITLMFPDVLMDAHVSLQIAASAGFVLADTTNMRLGA